MATHAPQVGMAAALAFLAAAASAQAPRALSLEEALRLAQAASETVDVAAAQVARAEGEELAARSARWPQLQTAAGYTRTLASEFEDIELDFGEGGDGGAGGGDGLGDLPFGQENRWDVGLSLSQTVWSGGRLRAQGRAAGAAADAARVGVEAARALTALEVVRAYFDAALYDLVVAITEATLEQAERALEQTRAAHAVGNTSEFELLRAQVTRDNERPLLLQRRALRDLAYLRLQQLLELPLAQPLQLTTDPETAALPAELVPGAAQAPADLAADPERLAAYRTPVREAEARVRLQEELVRVARAQRWPSVGVSSDYGRVAYPASGVPGWDETRTNWTVGLGLRLPLFTGGRVRGEVAAAEANLAAARAELERVRELALLEGRDAAQQRATAEAVWEASAGTVEQARRAYEIAEVRYREGISTQLELNDARLALVRARGNRIVAARNLQLARARVALLPDLPLGGAAVAAPVDVSAPAAAGVPSY